MHRHLERVREEDRNPGGKTHVKEMESVGVEGGGQN